MRQKNKKSEENIIVAITILALIICGFDEITVYFGFINALASLSLFILFILLFIIHKKVKIKRDQEKNDELISNLKKLKKEMEKPYVPSIGTCDICGEYASFWIGGKKLCYKCAIKELTKESKQEQDRKKNKKVRLIK